MSYIFFDESGDLGLDFTKRRTSKHFVVTFLFTQEKRLVEKIAKKGFTSLAPRERKGHTGVLHAVNELPKTRQRVLGELSSRDVPILALYLDKERVYTKLQGEREVLYNFVTNVLLDRIMTKKLILIGQKITLVASQRELTAF